MSGCHVPAMSSLEIENDMRKKFCIACKEMVPENCKCIWAAIRDLQCKVDNVEKEKIELKDHVLKMTESILRKKIKNAVPHQCPVCGGCTVRTYFKGYTEIGEPCLSCEGKGIVWG